MWSGSTKFSASLKSSLSASCFHSCWWFWLPPLLGVVLSADQLQDWEPSLHSRTQRTVLLHPYLHVLMHQSTKKNIVMGQESIGKVSIFQNDNSQWVILFFMLVGLRFSMISLSLSSHSSNRQPFQPQDPPINPNMCSFVFFYSRTQFECMQKKHCDPLLTALISDFLKNQLDIDMKTKT